MMKIKHATPYGEYELKLYKRTYTDNGNIAIQATIEEDGFEEPWSMITVNIAMLPDKWACLDTNNNGDTILYELLDAGYCNLLGYEASGFCTYPIVEFTDEFLKGLEE